MNPLLVIAHEATRTGAPRVLLELIRGSSGQIRRPIAIQLMAGGPLARQLMELHTASEGPIDPAAVVINSSLAADAAHRFDPDVPVLVYVHEQGEALAMLPSSARSALAERASSVMCVSEASRSDLLDLGVPESRLTVLAPPVMQSSAATDQEVEGVRNALHLGDRERLVLGCGEGNWRKGADLFLDTARLMAPLPLARFAWVGRRPRGFSRVLDHDTRALGLDDRLTWVGEVPDAAAWMACASVLLVTSREDPQPLVPLEAAFQSTPSVGFDLPGMDELAADGAMQTVPFPDTTALAKLATQVVEQPDSASAMIEYARLRARSRHAPEGAARTFADEVEGLLGRTQHGDLR